jgi:2-dehydropantoate 2-reductase
VLHADTILSRLLLISKSSDGQLISTYQDILNKRNTEIETMNMSIARVAESVGRSSLIKQTKLLGELIQIKSEKA